MIERRTLPRRLAAVLIASALAGCGAGMAAGPPVGPAAADPDAVASEARRATLPDGARQAAFEWELDEAGSRFRGRGVGRYQAPDRFRLDLFGPRGETYLAAALVGEEMRVPPGLAERFPLPSPALLWAAVGAVNPPAGARLLGADVGADATAIRYQLGDDVLEYRLSGGRLAALRRLGPRGAVAESVELTRGADGEVRRALYRDWLAYRSLTLTIESTENVASFPADTWSPPGTTR